MCCAGAIGQDGRSARTDVCCSHATMIPVSTKDFSTDGRDGGEDVGGTGASLPLSEDTSGYSDRGNLVSEDKLCRMTKRCCRRRCRSKWFIC